MKDGFKKEITIVVNTMVKVINAGENIILIIEI